MFHLDPIQLFLISATFILFLAFLAFFLVPSLKLWRRFNLVISGLQSIKHEHASADIPDRVLHEIMTEEPLKHLWREYCETLHGQSGVHKGEPVVTEVRATVAAELFFNTQVLVDTPLRSEFFKHLPGIFTGLGIIGTFNGLISGLRAFHVTENSAELKSSLTQLLAGVSDAFLFSASAIGLAMVVILIEKTAITRRYKQVEEICQFIDGFFDAGAGEEYLARIVRSSESTANAISNLKDGLVDDLQVLLTHLAERQIQAAQVNNQAMVQAIHESITSSLREPMQALTGIVQNSAQNQGQAVQAMLNELLTAFMAKLEETFGGQMSGMSSLMLETTSSMKSMQENFAQMLSSISAAGKDAGDAMGKQLEAAMAMAELRQREMNAQMEQFVTHVKELVSSSQTETNEQLKVMLGRVEENIENLVTTLNQQQSQVTETATKAQMELGSRAQDVVSGMGEQINALVKQSAEATAAMEANVEALRQITTESIGKMSAGAEAIYEASTEFAEAGNGVSGVLIQASEVSNKLVATGQSLEASSKAVQGVVAEFQRTRDSIAGMIAALESVIKQAHSEAGMTEDLLEKMNAITEHFKTAQIDTEAYMQKISGVMESSFLSFTSAMTKAIHQSRTDFDTSLSAAVGMLSAVIQDLAETQVKD